MPDLQSPPADVLRPLVEAALREDLGQAGDLTTDSIVPPDAQSRAHLVAREPGRLAGADAVRLVFEALDPGVAITWHHRDGDDVDPHGVVATLDGNARALLTGERTALNLLGRLSGIATMTRAFVEAVAGLPVRIVDTRKTTPGLRALEKYAVTAGGGTNHRFGLYDAVLIKDNHIAFAGGVREAVARVKGVRGVTIQVEVDSLAQLEEALTLDVDAVLLDNMTVPVLRQAVAMVGGRVITEASGGVTLSTVRAIAETGVDRISVGALTHSAPVLDVALDFKPPPGA